MNNARLWLVVKPTVGIPLFLGAVAVGSFAVHVAVLSNTTWVSDFLSGKPLGSGQQTAAIEAPVKTAKATGETPRVYMEPATATRGESVTIVMPDGRTAEAVFEAPPLTLAAKDTEPR